MPPGRRTADSPPNMPREVKQSYTKTIFPKPEAYKMSIAGFEKWLKSFSAECRTRVTLSLYRDWPRINLKQIPGEQYERRIFFYEASLDPSGFVFAEDFGFRDFVLRNQEWGGEGEYRILCNEQGVKGAVGTAQFTLEDADYPPRVDVRSIVQGWPRNEGFIKSLRVKGISLPGDNPEQDRQQREEEAEMNVAAPLAEHIVKQNAELLQELRDRRDEESEAATSEEAVMAEATSEAVRVVAEGAKEAISMVGTQAKEMARASAPQFNPIELFRAGRESAGDGGMQMLTFFMKSMEEQTKTFQAMHEKTLEYLREKDSRVEVAPALDTRSDIERLLESGQQIKQLGDLFGFSKRPRNDEDQAPRQLEPPRESAFERMLGKLAEKPEVLVMGLFGVTNLLQTAMGRGKPVEDVMKTAREVAGAVGGAQVPAGPDPREEERRRELQLAAFLKNVEPLFLLHFYDPKKENLDGFTFAQDFLTAQVGQDGQMIFTPEGPISELGQNQYRQIKTGGIEHFDRTIRNYNPIWSKVGGNIPKYTEFLKQFFTVFEEIERQQKEREALSRPASSVAN